MLIGQHTCDLVNKKLSLPPAWKDSMRGGGFITRGFERNLFMFTSGSFEELYKHITSLNIADPKARLLIRLILGSTHPVGFEKNNMILLPHQLFEIAGLKARAVIIGQGDYCEIWSPENWSKQQITLNSITENSRRFSSLSLFTHRVHDTNPGKS